MNRQPSASPARDGALIALLRRLRRYFRSPKGYLTLALLALGAIALPSGGGTAALLGVALATGTAMLSELLLVRLGEGVWRFPSSAMLTGLFIGLILDPLESWIIPVIAAVLAIDGKHLLRAGRSHIFNPAALGLLGVFALFGSGQSWWGALANLPLPAIVVLLLAGYLVADRANKLPAALAFVATYVGLLTAGAFLGGAATAAELFRAPFFNAAIFFACFMMTDPPTSPVRFDQQVCFGAVVGALSAAIYVVSAGGLYFLLAAVLAGNTLYAAWRQLCQARRNPAVAAPRPRIAALGRDGVIAASRGPIGSQGA